MKERIYDRLDRVKEDYPAVSFLVDVFEVYLDRRVSRCSAELAYYLMMTIFPLLIMIVSAVGWLPLSEKTVTNFLLTVIPSQSFDMLSGYVSYVLSHRSSSLFAAGLLMSITVGSAAFRCLLSASAEIYGRRNLRGIQYLLASFVLSILLLVLVYVSLIVVLTGRWFFRWFRSFFYMIPLPGNLRWIRLLVLLGVALLFLVLLYRVTAPWGSNRPTVVKGAIFTAVVLVAASVLFSYFIGLSTRYSAVYGSLTSVIILMLWLFLCGNIVILGNVLNYVSWRRKQGLPIRYLLNKQL